MPAAAARARTRRAGAAAAAAAREGARLMLAAMACGEGGLASAAHSDNEPLAGGGGWWATDNHKSTAAWIAFQSWKPFWIRPEVGQLNCPHARRFGAPREAVGGGCDCERAVEGAFRGGTHRAATTRRNPT